MSSSIVFWFLLFVFLILVINHSTSSIVSTTINHPLLDDKSTIFSIKSFSLNRCPISLLNRCQCGLRPFNRLINPNNKAFSIRDDSSSMMFVTNCTNSNFTDPMVIGEAPEETEMLIFRGNSFNDLPANLLPKEKRFEKLFLVDLSQNKIKSIHGKAFHNMRSVQTLVLNDNEISIDQESFRPRLFSSLKNMEELHLRQAFGMFPNRAEFLSTLFDIFAQSEVHGLLVLNLEMNFITNVPDDRIFCALPKLQRLSLAYNRLSQYNIDTSCLKNLRSIDLSNNKIASMTSQSIRYIESGPAYYHLNISENPFRCDCRLLDFFRFVRRITSGENASSTTAPKLEKIEEFRCRYGSQTDIQGKYFDDIKETDFRCLSEKAQSVYSNTSGRGVGGMVEQAEMANLMGESHMTESQKQEAIHRYRYYITLSYIVLSFLLSLLLFLVGVLIYTNREFIRTIWTVFLDELNSKRDYTALDKDGYRESSSTSSSIPSRFWRPKFSRRPKGNNRPPQNIRLHSRYEDTNVAEDQL